MAHGETLSDMPPIPAATPDARTGTERSTRGAAALALGLFTAALMGIPARQGGAEAPASPAVAAAQEGLQELRSAIHDFRIERGDWPGSDGTIATLGRDLLGGMTPYLAGVPENPLNGRTDVLIVRQAGGDARVKLTRGTAGWLYNATTGEVWLDAPGPSGLPPTSNGAKSPRWMDL